MKQCRAGCCRGALFLRLLPEERAAFEQHAARLGVELQFARDGSVRFLDHPGEHCPMLDDATSACRIYEQRPQRCRAFPDRVRPDCALSQIEVNGRPPTS